MRTVVLTMVGAFLLLFLVYPMASLLMVGFTGEPVNVLSGNFHGLTWSWQYYVEFIHTQRYYKGLGNSIVFSSAVTFLACVIGIFVALVLGRTAVPGRGLLRALAMIPLTMPTYLMALSVMFIFGKQGIFTSLTGLHWNPLTPVGTMLVQAFSFFPVVMLTTIASLEGLDPAVEEAAGVHGGDSLLVGWKVILPLLSPGVMAGAFLTFIRSFGDFATPLLLMPPRYKLIVVEAYRDMSGNTYWGGAAMLSTLMVLTVMAVMAIQKWYQERNKFVTVGGRAVASPRLYRSPVGCAVLLAVTLALLGFPIVNLVVLVMLSLAGSWGSSLFPTLSLANYRNVLAESGHFLANSLILCGLAVFFCLLLGAGVAWMLYRTQWWGKHVLDTVITLPFIIPGTAFAIALVTCFNAPPLALHLTAPLVVIAYIVTRTPYAVWSVTASLSQVGPSMEEASSTLGATGPVTGWKVLLPMIRPGLVAGGIMAFISCMTDVAITLMVCPPDWYPVSINIFLQTAESKYFVASAYGIVLMVFMFAAYGGMLALGKAKDLAA